MDFYITKSMLTLKRQSNIVMLLFRFCFSIRYKYENLNRDISENRCQKRFFVITPQKKSFRTKKIAFCLSGHDHLPAKFQPNRPSGSRDIRVTEWPCEWLTIANLQIVQTNVTINIVPEYMVFISVYLLRVFNTLFKLTMFQGHLFQNDKQR